MKLRTLRLWHDLTPRGGAQNMAFDEAMLGAAREPWLRVYRWSEPTISFGFSQSLGAIPLPRRSWPAVRRWTGGGVVEHDGDWTYALAVPPHIPLSGQLAADTYRWIHEAVIAAFEESGVTGCALQARSTSDGMGVCFEEPARFDVVWQGRKVAGAAQRRSKGGLLHQGTIQPLRPPGGFAGFFARALADQVEMVGQHDALSRLEAAAELLVAGKYGATSWLENRRLPGEDRATEAVA